MDLVWPVLENIRFSGEMLLHCLISVLFMPYSAFIYTLSFMEQLMSELLLSLGRPTPSQCAVYLKYFKLLLLYILRSVRPVTSTFRDLSSAEQLMLQQNWSEVPVTNLDMYLIITIHFIMVRILMILCVVVCTNVCPVRTKKHHRCSETLHIQ